MTYLISPSQETSWTFQQEFLLEAIEQKWPDSVFAFETTALFKGKLAATITTPAGEVDFRPEATEASQALYLDGQLDAVICFAVWWREQVPPSQELQLYDDGYVYFTDLTPGITAAAVAVGMSDPA